MTGIPGSYARCRRGIDLLLERKLPLVLKTMVMTLNHHELDQMKSLASNYGLQFRYDPIMHAAIDGSSRPTRFRLTPKEVLEVEKADSARASQWPERMNERLNIKVTDRNLYLCGAGKHSFHIDSSGRLSICISDRNQSYDLQTGSFKEGWEIFLPQVFSRQYSDRFQCADCHLRLICAQCPAYAEIEYKNAEACVEYLCQITKNRFEEFNIVK